MLWCTLNSAYDPNPEPQTSCHHIELVNALLLRKIQAGVQGSGDSYEVKQTRQQVRRASRAVHVLWQASKSASSSMAYACTCVLARRSHALEEHYQSIIIPSHDYMLSLRQVMDGRDALARSLYEKMFSQLVATINKSFGQSNPEVSLLARLFARTPSALQPGSVLLSLLIM